MKWIEFNANHEARIKPNDRTLKSFLEHWEPYIGLEKAKEYYNSKLDNEGYYKDQLWCIMSCFGNAFNGSVIGPFDSTIQLEDKS